VADDRRIGAGGAIYLGGAVGGGGTRVTAKTQWTLNLSRDFADGSAFGDTNKRWFGGLRDTQGTYNGILDLDGDALFDAASLGPQLIYLYADDGTASFSEGVVLVGNGSGFLDATVDCGLATMVTCNGAFRASSNWTFPL
jgi:hypothetical protein